MKKKETDGNTLAGNLDSLRLALLALHKALVDSERVQYEAAIGKILSPNHFLHLLTSDPWFAWLSPLSKLIVAIDEASDAEEPVSAESLQGFQKQAASLLTAAETGAGFARHYSEALQRDPDVVLAHAGVTRVPGWAKSRGQPPPGL